MDIKLLAGESVVARLEARVTSISPQLGTTLLPCSERALKRLPAHGVLPNQFKRGGWNSSRDTTRAHQSKKCTTRNVKLDNITKVV